MVNFTNEGLEPPSDCFGFPIRIFTAQSRESMIMVILLNVIFSISTTLTNTLILVTVWRTVSLHSASNTLLFGLALSDLCVGSVAQPIYTGSQVLLLNSQFYSCSLFLATVLTSAFLLGVTFCTVTAISIDRYLAIYLHLRYEEVVTEKRAKLVLLVVWLSWGSILLLWLLNSGFVALIGVFMGVTCTFATSFAWIRIYQVVSRHQLQIQDQIQAGNQQFDMASFRKSAVNTLYVLVVFLFCYLPFICALGVLTLKFTVSNYIIFQYAYTIVLLNSSINPLVYCWRLRAIRIAAKQFLTNLVCP